MDEEQSGNRNGSVMDPVAERTTQSRREKTPVVLEDKEMILRQIKRRS
jgi:hypothetical protein